MRPRQDSNPAALTSSSPRDDEKIGSLLGCGPQSAYFAEQFSTRMRYSGSSLAYQLAAILGAMAALICTALIAMTGSVYSVAAFVIIIALVSLTCSYFMTETLRSGLRSDEIMSPPLKVGVQVPAPFQLPSGVYS